MTRMIKKIPVFHILIALIIYFIMPGALTVFSAEPQDVIILDKQKESRGEAKMPPARFSHSIHKKNGVTCEKCHPDVFVAKKGANDITMKRNIDGEFCGACHMGSGAFLLSTWNMSDCEKCHN